MSKQADQRLRLIMFVFAAAFAVVIGRALYVQILQASALAARAHGQQNSTTVVATSRGRILDATGQTLAVDVPAKDLMVYPSKVQDPRPGRLLHRPEAGLPAQAQEGVQEAR